MVICNDMPGAEAKLKAEAEVKLAVNFYRTDVGSFISRNNINVHVCVSCFFTFHVLPGLREAG